MTTAPIKVAVLNPENKIIVDAIHSVAPIANPTQPTICNHLGAHPSGSTWLIGSFPQ